MSERNGNKSGRSADGTRPSSWLVSNRLWFVAAVLGFFTLYYSMQTIHDRGRLRTALHVVNESMAQHVIALAGAELEVIGNNTFAPALSAPASKGSEGGLAAIVTEQKRAVACRCRAHLPVRAFLRIDLASGRITSAEMETGPALREEVVLELTRAEAARPAQSRSSATHVHADKRLGDAMLVTYVARGDSATSVVYAAVAPSTALMHAIFRPHPMSDSLLGRSMLMADVDSTSMHVFTTDSLVRFGMLGHDREKPATVAASGPLEGLNVTIALRPGEVNMPLPILLPHERLWRMGVLIIVTVIMLLVAYQASRRELLLARARSDFIAGVSHELRMPLAQILLASETMAMGRAGDDRERTSLTNSIVREARRLKALVDNLLFVSRSGAVGVRAHLRRVEVGALFTDVIEAVDLAVKDAGQTIDVHEGEGLAVQADSELVRQALVNLVDNAIKYGKEGQRIQLGAIVTGMRVLLYVDDHGAGIPKHERDRLFDAYERLGRDQVSERTGTGLGLAVVAQIARACGGTAKLDDAPGGGTRASIELAAGQSA